MRVLLLSLALAAAGCGAATTASAPTAEAAAKPFTNEKGELVCPVSGEVMKDTTAAVSHQVFDGKDYYFCCAPCAEEFAKNPAEFANGHHLAAAAAPGGDAVFGAEKGGCGCAEEGHACGAQ